MKKKFILLIAIFTLTISIQAALASSEDTSADGTRGPVSLTNPLTNTTGDVPGGIPGLIGRVINGVLGVVGSLALIMFIYGGLLWMTSGGNDEKVKQGKDVLIWATLGLFIIFASYALVNFIIFKGIGAVGGGSGGIQTDEIGRAHV